MRYLSKCANNRRGRNIQSNAAVLFFWAVPVAFVVDTAKVQTTGPLENSLTKKFDFETKFFSGRFSHFQDRSNFFCNRVARWSFQTNARADDEKSKTFADTIFFLFVWSRLSRTCGGSEQQLDSTTMMLMTKTMTTTATSTTFVESKLKHS